MIRVACALQLVALAVLAIFLRHSTGPTATALSFLGMPLVGVVFLLSALAISARLRRRTSHVEGGSR